MKFLISSQCVQPLLIMTLVDPGSSVKFVIVIPDILWRNLPQLSFQIIKKLIYDVSIDPYSIISCVG